MIYGGGCDVSKGSGWVCGCDRVVCGGESGDAVALLEMGRCGLFGLSFAFLSAK